MSDQTPNITPYLYYRDAHAAIDFLERVLGFARVSGFRTNRVASPTPSCGSATGS